MRAFGSSVRKYGTVAAALFWAQSASAAKVACVGDSITFGHGLDDPSTESYPAVLADRLGAGHTVRNFGVSSWSSLWLAFGVIFARVARSRRWRSRDRSL